MKAISAKDITTAVRAAQAYRGSWAEWDAVVDAFTEFFRAKDPEFDSTLFREACRKAP